MGMTRRIVVYGMVAICVLLTRGVSTAAGSDDVPRGELGVEIGLRLPDNDLVPDGDNGLSYLWGIEGAWAFNQTWALFFSLNISDHDSRQLCAETPNCSALTPNSHYKVLTAGVERRSRPGPKGGQWFLGLGTGIMDVEWTGVQIHHPILSLSAGRRSPLGPGVLRWTFRIETGIGSRTDAQVQGSLDKASLTDAVLAVGWGFDFGKGDTSPATAAHGAQASANATARVAGR
jgi:hypothetical protein